MSAPAIDAGYREGLAVNTSPGVTTPATPAAAAAYVTLRAAVVPRVEKNPVVATPVSSPVVTVTVAVVIALPAAAEMKELVPTTCPPPSTTSRM
jgi:hypothetical protein